MDRIEFTVSDELAGLRVDKCISEYCEEFSRTYIKRLIDDKLVHVNGRSCKGSLVVKEGDIIDLNNPDLKVPDILPEDIPLDIIYEDDDVVVVNKKKGMVVHPANGHYSGTLVNALMYILKDDLSGINGFMRPGIVHRIDMNTTGSVIVCKNDRAHNDIAAQLKEHSITRRYIAIVNGRIKDDCGRIDAPIGRSEKDRKKMAVNFKNGKHAVTNYRVLERFDRFTCIECSLETGRTHQIRVHMAYIGHPILGDDKYCSLRSPFKLEGQALHAMVLGFVSPSSREYITTYAPLPDYFKKILKALGSSLDESLYGPFKD